jgi:HD-like signal output (HDOD) protein
MHDMGKIILNRINPEGYKKVIDVCKAKGVDLQLVESRVFGINHAEIGELLGNKWGLQSQLIEAMAFHHALDNASPENRKIVLAIYISNAYVKAESVGFGGNTYIQELTEEQWNDLGITPEVLQSFQGHLIEGVERASVFLQTAS